jgi:hypothetical protein
MCTAFGDPFWLVLSLTKNFKPWVAFRAQSEILHTKTSPCYGDLCITLVTMSGGSASGIVDIPSDDEWRINQWGTGIGLTPLATSVHR